MEFFLNALLLKKSSDSPNVPCLRFPVRFNLTKIFFSVVFLHLRKREEGREELLRISHNFLTQQLGSFKILIYKLLFKSHNIGFSLPHKVQYDLQQCWNPIITPLDQASLLVPSYSHHISREHQILVLQSSVIFFK